MTRDGKLITAFAVVAVLSLGAVGAGLVMAPAPAPAPPPPVIARDVPVGPDGGLSVQFVGETMLGGAAQPLIDQRGVDWPLQAARTLLTADFTVAVADAPISALTLPWSMDEEDSYSSRPEVARALAAAGIDAMTLASGHIFDVGPVGVADTIGNLDGAGIAAFGAGPEIGRAEQPLLLRSELGTIAVVGMSDARDEADRDDPGTLELSRDAIARGIRDARLAGADWVIAEVYWGDRYKPVSGEQRYWAQQLAAAGYDLVVGSGPHVVQPIEFIGSTPVVYGLGPFVFGAPGPVADPPVSRVGLAVSLELDPDGSSQLSARCLLPNDAAGLQPRPCTVAEAHTHLLPLNPALTVQGDVGVLACACFGRDGK